MNYGTIIRWNRKRGFGFIKDAKEDKDVFIHIKAFGGEKNQVTPRNGDKIRYVIEADAKGRLRASQASMVQKPQWRIMAKQFVIFWLIGMAATTLLALTSPVTFLWYLGMSSLCYTLYVIDKANAVRGEWRIPEGSLQLLALFGGWPGGLLAQHVHCHKLAKKRFQRFFWLAVFINVAGLLWILVQPAHGGII